MQIYENVPLGPLTTFGIGGPARWMAIAVTEEDVRVAVAWAADRGVPLFVLGGGSNLIVPDSGFPGLVLRLSIADIRQEPEAVFDVGAGANWDEFVSLAVHAGCQGIECLAGIPGSVGGTPVQNVGAYGQEVASTIDTVRAFDRTTAAFVELPNAACRFRYRQSRFNTEEPGRFIVTRVRFRLHPGGAPQLKYADLQRHFASFPGDQEHAPLPSLEEVASAVRQIRRSKGMLLVAGDPDSRSAGSFFKNPIVSADALARIAASASVDPAAVPSWPAGEGRIKLPAAWLLERAGFVKGYGKGRVGISSRHTLALVNRGGATFADLEQLQDEIVGCIAEKFGIVLEREPVLPA